MSLSTLNKVGSAAPHFASEWEPPLRILYNLALSSDEQKIVQITDKMLTLMSYHGQSHVVQIKNLNVGVHPQNRGGKLLADREVHSKGAGVVKAGFAMKYCKPDRAVCFECDTTSMQTQSWTCRLSESDMFPKIKAVNIKVGSIGCSHLVQFLNCIEAGVRTSEQSLCRPGESVISKSMLCEDDPVLAVAVDEGISWTVISSQVESAFPLLPGIIARALNVEHHVAKGEDWTQQLSTIASMAETELHCTKNIDWTRLGKVVAKTQPPCLGDIPAHIKLCQIYGGGTNMTFIKELGSYLRLEMHLGRVVSGDFVNRLASIAQPPGSLTPRLVMAFIKGNATGDEVRGLVGTCFGAADVQLIKKKPLLAAEAETLMNRARALMTANNISDLSRVGKLDIALAKFLCNKLKKSEHVDDMSELVAKFIDDIMPSVANARPTETAISAPRSSAAVNSDILEYTNSGEAVNAGKASLAALGFHPGVLVELKKQTKKGQQNDEQLESTDVDLQYRIAYANDEGSAGLHRINILGETDKSSVTLVTFDDMSTKYKIVRSPIELREGWPGNAVETSDEWTASLSHAVATIAMHQMHGELECMGPEAFTVQHRPVQRVRVNHAYDRHDLVMVPLTTRLHKPKGAEQSQLILKFDDSVGTSFVIGQCVSETCVSVFFIIRKSTVAADCNMIMSEKSTTVGAPHNGGLASITVTIPTAINSTDLKEGDELVLHVPETRKHASQKDPVGIKIGSYDAKKQRR